MALHCRPCFEQLTQEASVSNFRPGRGFLFALRRTALAVLTRPFLNPSSGQPEPTQVLQGYLGRKFPEQTNDQPFP